MKLNKQSLTVLAIAIMLLFTSSELCKANPNNRIRFKTTGVTFVNYEKETVEKLTHNFEIDTSVNILYVQATTQHPYLASYYFIKSMIEEYDQNGKCYTLTLESNNEAYTMKINDYGIIFWKNMNLNVHIKLHYITFY